MEHSNVIEQVLSLGGCSQAEEMGVQRAECMAEGRPGLPRSQECFLTMECMFISTA